MREAHVWPQLRTTVVTLFPILSNKRLKHITSRRSLMTLMLVHVVRTKMESSESNCVHVEPVLFGGDRPRNWGNTKDVFSIAGKGDFTGLSHNVRDLSHELHRVYTCWIAFWLIIKLCLVIFKLYIFFKFWNTCIGLKKFEYYRSNTLPLKLPPSATTSQRQLLDHFYFCVLWCWPCHHR